MTVRRNMGMPTIKLGQHASINLTQSKLCYHSGSAVQPDIPAAKQSLWKSWIKLVEARQLLGLLNAMSEMEPWHRVW